MRQYTFANIINFIFTLCNIYLFISIVFGILLNVNSYNWDNVENMYFASRILYGELPGIREFYDKFLLVPLLFTVFSYHKTVNSWVATNVVASFLASWVLSATIVQIVRNYSNITISVSTRYFLALFYLYLLSSIQGEFIYINPMAASFYIFFIYFTVQSENRTKYTARIRHYFFILASLCSAIVISIRPYYLLSVLFIMLWRVLFYQIFRFTKINKFYFFVVCSRILKTLFYCVFLLTIFFTIFNVFPYIVLRTTDSLFISIHMLLLDLKPQVYTETLRDQFSFFGSLNVVVRLFLCIIIFVLLCFTFFNKNMMRKFNMKNINKHLLLFDILSMSVVPIILLEAVIFSKHYWPHYMQLFIPNIIILCGMMLCLFVQVGTLNSIEDQILIFFKTFNNNIGMSILPMKIVNFICYKISTKKISKTALYVIAIIWIVFEKNSNNSYIASINRIMNNEAEFVLLNTIENIRNERRAAGFGGDFLYTSNMFSHWMLNESRHGFPHASHFSAISQGWFSNWNPRSVMPGFPTTTDSLCRKITLSGPSIVLVPKNSALFQCMSSRPPINYSINDIFFDYDGPVAVMFRDIS